MFHRKGGVQAAVDMVRARSSKHFDPQLTTVVEKDSEALFAGLDDNTVDNVLDAEPIERPPLSEDELDSALEAIGDFCDLRCPYFAGHARGTAELVAAAAQQLQLPAPEVTLLRRAALVHDVGRFGVPGSVWDRPGPLSRSADERMQQHIDTGLCAQPVEHALHRLRLEDHEHAAMALWTRDRAEAAQTLQHFFGDAGHGLARRIA